MEGLRCPVPMSWKIFRRIGICACRISACRRRSTCASQHQTAGFFVRELPHRVTRRRRNVGRRGTTGPNSHFGLLGRLIFRSLAGPRAGAFETRRNWAICLAGTKEDSGARFAIAVYPSWEFVDSGESSPPVPLLSEQGILKYTHLRYN